MTSPFAATRCQRHALAPSWKISMRSVVMVFSSWTPNHQPSSCSCHIRRPDRLENTAHSSRGDPEAACHGSLRMSSPHHGDGLIQTLALDGELLATPVDRAV